MSYTVLITKDSKVYSATPLEYRFDGKNADCTFIINAQKMQTEMCDYLFDRFQVELRNEYDECILDYSLNSYSDVVDFIYKAEEFLTQMSKKYGINPLDY